MESVLDNRSFNRGVKQYLDSLDRMEGKTGRVGGVLGKALGGIGKVAAGAMAVGLAAGAAAVGAVGLAIAKAIPLAADFQSQLVGLQLAARESGMSFSELHDLALAVGGDVRLLGVSATGAADAMTGLYKAGLTTTEIFGDVNAYMEEGAELGGALRAAIDLAAATELDMVQASDLAAVALSTFGGELETEAERAEFVATALDDMVRAADASVAEVSDLAAALTNAGPVMAQYGYGVEEVNTALALLSTRGIKGAEAGTALRSMMTNMLRPTKTVTGALEELNVSLYDQEGQLKPLNTIIGEFQASLAGVTEEQRNQYVTTIAGTYGMRAMNTLLAEGTEGWDAMREATASAAGIQEQAAARAKTFAGRMEALRGTVETLKIGIGEAFLPVLTDLMGRFSELVSEHGPALTAAFQKVAAWLGENLPKAIETVTGFVKAQLIPALTETWRFLKEDIPAAVAAATEVWEGTLRPALGKISAVIEDNLNPILAGLATVLLLVVVPAFVSWATAAGAAAVATIAALAPVVLPIAAIAAAVALLVAAWEKDWGGIRTTLTDVWENSLKPAFEAVKNWCVTELPAAVARARDWFVEAWTKIRDWTVGAWKAVQSAVRAGMNYIKNFIPNTLAAIQGTWNRVWGSVRDFVATTWATIKTTVYDALDSLFAEMGLDLAEMLATWGQIWEDVKLIAETVWGLIYDTVTGKVEEVRADVETKVTALQTAWNAIWEAVSAKAAEIWTAIYDWVSEKVEAVRVFVTEKIQALKDFWGPVWDAVAAKIAEVWDAIYTAASTKVSELWSVVTRKIQDVFDWIRGKVGSFVSLGSDLIDGLKEGAKRAAGRLISAITGVVKDAIGAAKRLLGIGSASKVFIQIGREIGEGLIEGVRQSAKDVQEAIVGLFDVGAALRGLGAGAAQRMQERLIDPAKARLKELEEMLGAPEAQEWAWQRRAYWLAEQARLTKEIAANEARMAALRRVEQDLGFLQQQAALLELIREHGLDAAEILGGMTLGVEANVADVIEAMTKAMQQVVLAAQAELGISSPSKVAAREVGAPIMQGVTLGIEGYGGALARAFSRALMAAPAWGAGPALAAPAMVSGATNTVNLNMDTTINDRLDAATFEARVLQIVTKRIGG